MNTNHYSEILKLVPEDNHRLFNLCGELNGHLKLIESGLGVMIKQRGYTFSVSGERHAVQQACETLHSLYHETRKLNTLEPREVHIYLQTVGKKSIKVQDKLTQAQDQSQDKPQDKHKPQDKSQDNLIKEQDNHMDIRLRKGVITARGENQVTYIKNILQHDINFAIGPAGTGKTYLAVACAVAALESERVSRIILVRPIVEAGEKLGFLPGDIAQKVHPYLKPLYDALYEMLGFEKVDKLIERDVIELLPLAFMRGRSLNDSYIILDEGQNSTVEQMKMFLTRIGFNSKAVITGDITQIDLINRRDSGLINARDVLQGIPGISFTQFQASDVVRHPLVQTIVEAYERNELQQQTQK